MSLRFRAALFAVLLLAMTPCVPERLPMKVPATLAAPPTRLIATVVPLFTSSVPRSFKTSVPAIGPLAWLVKLTVPCCTAKLPVVEHSVPIFTTVSPVAAAVSRRKTPELAPAAVVGEMAALDGEG